MEVVWGDAKYCFKRGFVDATLTCCGWLLSSSELWMRVFCVWKWLYFHQQYPSRCAIFQKILSEVLMSKILPKVAQLSCKKCLQKYQHRLFFYLSFLLPSHAVLWRLPWWWLHHFFQQFCNAFHCLWDLSSFAHQDLQFSLRSIFHLFCCSISNATLSYSELQI